MTFLLRLFPFAGCTLALVAVWTALAASGWFHGSALPSPFDVMAAFRNEVRTGRVFIDIVVSLYRVSWGFVSAILVGLPIGLLLGQMPVARRALLPLVNFFRNLSPLAWIPFAVLWFGIGDGSSIFLIFISVVFPVVLSVMAAVANIPAVYFQVADTYEIHGVSRLWRVTAPAMLPAIVTVLRLMAGLAWMVVVAAEMLAGREGLGFAVMDARNGLRTDLLIVQMLVIGALGMAIDWIFARLQKLRAIRWGYEQ